MLQKSTKHSCVTRIITKSTSIGVLAPTYSRLWFQFLGAPLKMHKLLFYANDVNHCGGGTKHKYALDKPAILEIWPNKVETNLTQDEIKSFEEVGFVLNIQQLIFPQSLFGGECFHSYK
jgi:hypothetical protein